MLVRVFGIAIVLLSMGLDPSFADTPSFSFGSIMMDRVAGSAESVSVSSGSIMMGRVVDGAESASALRLQDGDAPADTTNKALDDMLAEFMADPNSKEISHDSWTYTAHRFLGYAVLIGAVTQAALGIYTYNQEKDGTVPGTADAHKYLGYTIVGLSVAQTGLGFYDFWKIRDRDTGKTKRWVHLGLSTLATAGFIAAAVIANDSREQIESGQAGLEGKTFEDLYGDHRTVGLLATTSVVLTAIVIVW